MLQLKKIHLHSYCVPFQRRVKLGQKLPIGYLLAPIFLSFGAISIEISQLKIGSKRHRT